MSRWIWTARRLALGTLASCLALTGCGSGANRTFSLTINRPPVAVSSALSDISFQTAGSAEAEAGALFPEAGVSQSRPSDHELIYVVRGDKPEKDIRVHFTFESASAGSATALKAEVQVPDIVLTVNGVRKTIDGAKIARLLENDLAAIKSALESGRPIGTARQELAGLLLGIAVANHQSTMDRALAYNAHPGSLARDVLARFGADDADGQDSADAPGVDPGRPANLPGNGAAGAAVEPGHDPAPGEDAAGTEPRPAE